MAFGLGRGLEALIPNKPVKPARPDPAAHSATNELELGAITPNPHQPRKQFKLPELEDLAASIKEHGILEPLVVSPTQRAGKFILIAGERRMRAAELAGLKKVPVVVRQTDDQEKLELALIENIQRQDLNPLEEAKALRKLLRDFSLSQEQVAKRVGRSRSAVANCLRLLDLASEVQRALLSEQISEGHAKCLVTLGKPDQLTLLQEVTSQHLSVRQTEIRARAMTSSAAKNKGGTSKPTTLQDPAAARLGRSLSSHLGARVEVSGQKSGQISIVYHSAEERQRIAEKIIGAATGSTGDSEFSQGMLSQDSEERPSFTV